MQPAAPNPASRSSSNAYEKPRFPLALAAGMLPGALSATIADRRRTPSAPTCARSTRASHRTQPRDRRSKAEPVQGHHPEHDRLLRHGADPRRRVRHGLACRRSAAKKDEQPQHKVRVDAFWMQAHEVTWDEYRLFMFATQAGEIAHKDELVDAVSRPTRPYVEMSFGMGINGFPAISMTQHAANKYAEWLSASTGEFYRLPTEAEWEYACRAGADGTRAVSAGRLRLVRGQQRGQVSEGRNQEAQCLGTLRHARQRHGVDARSVRPVSRRSRQVNPWVKATQALSARRPRRLLERSAGDAALRRPRGLRCLLETAGPAIAQKHLVSDRRAVAGLPPGSSGEASQPRKRCTTTGTAAWSMTNSRVCDCYALPSAWLLSVRRPSRCGSPVVRGRRAAHGDAGPHPSCMPRTPDQANQAFRAAFRPHRPTGRHAFGLQAG